MSEEDLELLITLDDPEGAPIEDTFNHLAAKILSSIGSVSRSANEQKPLVQTRRKVKYENTGLRHFQGWLFTSTRRITS